MFFIDVWFGLYVVGIYGLVNIQFVVFQCMVLCYCMQIDFCWNGVVWDILFFFVDIMMFFVSYYYVCRQMVSKGVYFMCSIICGRLFGQGEWIVIWLGNFVGQQVQVVDQVVGLYIMGMLVEVYCLVGDDFFVWIGIQLCQLF